MFEHGDYVYIAYAGATVDKYYNTNVMRAAKNADLQDLSSWTTADFPSFDTNDTYTGTYGADEASYERKQAGPGHISLAHDEAGNIVMAYHARPYPEIHSGSAAGGLFDQDRNTWGKAVNVRANGMLDMSLTKDQEVAPANRTVTITVTVGEPDTPVEPSITGIRVKSEPTKTKYTVGEQFSADGLVIEATMSDGTVKTLDAADYTVGDVDMSAVGTKTVTVALKANDQLTTSFVVTVSARPSRKPGSATVPAMVQAAITVTLVRGRTPVCRPLVPPCSALVVPWLCSPLPASLSLSGASVAPERIQMLPLSRLLADGEGALVSP